MTRLKIAAGLVLAVTASALAYVAAGQKDKPEQGPAVHGVVKFVDAGKNALVVEIRTDPKIKKTEEKTFAVAPDVRIILEDVLTKQLPPHGQARGPE